MTNGDINGYMFFGQCVQAPIAVPKPGSEHLYYIFTSDGFSSSPTNGLQYHVVDMSMNGGLGAVVEKNVQIYDLNSEQMCVTRHANTCDYWLIGHDRNSASYLSWYISAAGVDTVPVVSSTGLDYSLVYQYPGNANWTGGVWLKCSPQGDKLASLVHWRYQNSGRSDEIWLSSLDASDGVVSGAFVVPLDSAPAGFSFSPNGQVFYAESGENIVKLDQFDLSTFDSSAVNSSRLNLNTYAFQEFASDLEIGPDGRIYGCTAYGFLLGKDSLPVIHQPDVIGAGCQIEQWAIGLNGRFAWLQLLDYVSSFSSPMAPAHSCAVELNESATIPPLQCWIGAEGLVVDGLVSKAAFDFTVLNALGQTVAFGELPSAERCVLPIQGLASGHYFIQISSPRTSTQVLRFVNP
jgi:hypothetical protein